MNAPTLKVDTTVAISLPSSAKYIFLAKKDAGITLADKPGFSKMNIVHLQ